MNPLRWARTARKEKPEAFQGFHSDNMLFIADEASGIENVIFEVGEGAMSTPSAKTILTGNPTRNDGYFHAAFHKNRALWQVFQVSCQNSKNVDPSYIEEMKTKYGEDSDIYRVRVLGEFPAASSLQFIPSDLVEEAQEREEQCFLHDPMILGVDVARFGDDQSIIFPRRGRDARTFPLQKYRNLDTMQLAARVAEAVREFKPDAVFVDGGGVGGGVVDRLNQLSIDCIEVNFGSKADEGRYANKRAEMWGRMKEWLEGAAIPDGNDLMDDLVGVEYGFTAKNQIQLERKEDMKKRGLASPDMADALALTFAYPVAPKGDEILNRHKSRQKAARFTPGHYSSGRYKDKR